MPAGSKGELKRVIPEQNKMKYNGIPIFQLPKETKIGSKNRRDMFENQCSIEERERLFVRVIWRLEQWRAREIGFSFPLKNTFIEHLLYLDMINAVENTN